MDLVMTRIHFEISTSYFLYLLPCFISCNKVSFLLGPNWLIVQNARIKKLSDVPDGVHGIRYHIRKNMFSRINRVLNYFQPDHT